LAIAPFDAAAARLHQAAWARHLGQPVEVTSSIGMKLRLIPPGEFLMGSPESEREHSSGEGPQHRVRITKPFYLGTYAVTQAEYQQIMGKNPSSFSAGGAGKDQVAGMDTSRFPVEDVFWDDAVEFCRKLSAKEGKEYRLPTEAEWEYACRAGTTTVFHFGDTSNGREANCKGTIPYGTEEKGPNLERPTVVGSYRPNSFGLYDMHGNVWQWCADWFGADYYAASPPNDPQGPDSGTVRVFRGGSWNNRPGVSGSGIRSWSGIRAYYTGFRLARTK